MRQEGPEGVSHPAPRPTTTVPAADLAGRPDLTERNLTTDAPVPETGGRPSPTRPSPGKDSCTRQTATRAVLLAGRIVGYTMTGTHANRIDPKRSAKIGGSELPAHQGCDDFSCRVRGPQYTSADYTASMNKYGIHRFGGKNRRVPPTAQQQVSFNATCAGKNSSTSRIYHTRRKAIKEVASWIEH